MSSTVDEEIEPNIDTKDGGRLIIARPVPRRHFPPAEATDVRPRSDPSSEGADRGGPITKRPE